MKHTIVLIAFALIGLTTLSKANPVDDTLNSAREAIASGDTQNAIAILEELDSDSAESFYLFGLAYQDILDQVGVLKKRGVARKLRAALQQSLELNPAHVGAREELADFYHFAPRIVGGSDKKAEEQIRLLAQHAPAASLKTRARHASSANEHREAEHYLDQAIALSKDYAELWYLRGRARQKLLEKDVEALADFKRAIELGWTNTLIDFYIGRLCVRLNIEHDLAERSLLRFIERSEPEYQAFGHYRLAALRERQGRLTDASREAQTALDLNPEFEEASALLLRVIGKLAATNVQ